MTGMVYCVPPIQDQLPKKIILASPPPLSPLIHCSKRSPSKEDPPGRNKGSCKDRVHKFVKVAEKVHHTPQLFHSLKFIFSTVASTFEILTLASLLSMHGKVSER